MEIEKRRQRIIETAIETAQQVIGRECQSELEANYVTYKVGANLLSGVMEKWDLGMVASDIQTVTSAEQKATPGPSAPVG
jgi:hypothetical protein